MLFRTIEQPKHISSFFKRGEFTSIISFFSYGRTRHLPDFGLATSQFLLDDVICQREDGSVPDTIADCRHAGWGDTDCTNDQIARVRCGEPGTSQFANCFCN